MLWLDVNQDRLNYFLITAYMCDCLLPVQELFAYAITNMGSSFFSSFATSASLSRSLIQEQVGGVTQVSRSWVKGHLHYISWKKIIFNFLCTLICLSLNKCWYCKALDWFTFNNPNKEITESKVVSISSFIHSVIV